jgi:hypothetical protein
MSFTAREFAENTARTLSRLRPEREYWVVGEEDAGAVGSARSDDAVEGAGADGGLYPDTSSAADRPAPKSPVIRRADVDWLALPPARPDRLMGDQQI